MFGLLGLQGRRIHAGADARMEKATVRVPTMMAMVKLAKGCRLFNSAIVLMIVRTKGTGLCEPCLYTKHPLLSDLTLPGAKIDGVMMLIGAPE